MKRILTYQIYPIIPENLFFLEVLARNLWWCWKPDAVNLFRRIDPQLWQSSNSNPIQLLAQVKQKRLEKLAEDDSFLAHLQRVKERFENRVTKNIDATHPIHAASGPVAYFSMEFGIHESIPIFAGGLGVLAGDYLKAASNMALPMVGVGLLYRKGYLRQFLNQEGWQQEEYPEVEFSHLPIERARDPQGNEITITLDGPEGAIRAFVWRIRIGHTALFLLDTNLPENSAFAREITARLYAAEPRIRLAQEVLLGIGGMRALAAMGIFPCICHMNEGHSAFSTVERLAMFMKRQAVDLETAIQIVTRCTVFTTHTPVAAGHDAFPADLVEPYMRPFAADLGIGVEKILAWGQHPAGTKDIPFSMFLLGLKFSQYRNAVSHLHGRTSRRMWSHLWPDCPVDEIPISHVTNGIHVSTFIAPELSALFERHLGPEWYMSSRKPENIQRIDEIYDDELWRAHEMCRTRLVRTCRDMMRRQYERRNAPRNVMAEIETVLDPEVLTIAFARRFATYKRAALLLQDPQRLKAMIQSNTRPVQFVFAGKAHPSDNEGKELIKRIVQFARQADVRQRVVFIENYDMALARCLVQGADIWLNTPRRPNEACGTSGMKAGINGVLNVSIMDGWWCEGYHESCGWPIGRGETYADVSYQDSTESQALYNVLENEVIPCFYEKRNGDLPRNWVKMMKASMKMIMKNFCSLHMVGEYEKRYYLPILSRIQDLLADGAAEANRLSRLEKRLYDLWPQIRIAAPQQSGKGPFRVGEDFEVTVEVHLGSLNPEEIEVQIYNGHMRAVDDLQGINSITMTVSHPIGGGDYLFTCRVPCKVSGRYGFSVRITPRGDAHLKALPGLITWY